MRMKTTLEFCKVITYTKSLSDEELHALLVDLIGAHVFKGESNLINFLLKDNLCAFKELAQTMNTFELKGDENEKSKQT